MQPQDFLIKKDREQFYIDMLERIDRLIQSDDKISMKTFQMDFKFIMAPVGATKNGTESRDRESIYKKTSVNYH